MNTIQLQSVGHVPAIPAGEIKEGDVRMYNFGTTSVVVKVIEKTAKTLAIITFSDGKYYMSDIRKTSLVAIVERGQDVSMHNPKEAYNVSGKTKGMIDVSEYFQVETVEEVEVIEVEETIQENKENSLIGRKVFGQWGCMTGWDYGTITNESEFDITIQWEDGNEQMIEVYNLIHEYENLNAIGVYLLPIEEVTEAIEPVEIVEETIAEVATTQETEVVNGITVTYKMNDEQNGVELYFNEKPSEEVREQLKANKFRWAKFKKCWYAKQSEETIAFAKQLAETETVNSEPVVYPEIDIEDVETYTVSQDIQDREHDSAWIFRRNKRDHNKEIQELFATYNEKVVTALQGIGSDMVVYKLKDALQRFKRKYHETYVKWLTAKANNPSWAVTGRGNLNVSRYNKGIDRQNKLMFELSDLTKEMDNKIEYYVNKAYKMKREQVQREVASSSVNVEFKTETKEFEYMNCKEKKRVHVYGDYWIAKLWGCFRVFKGNKEVYSTKTTEKLEDAKKYVAYLMRKEAV